MKHRDGLPEMPPSVAALPVDSRGYPVPWFVRWIDGRPEFRIMDEVKIVRCIKEQRCWICGEPLQKPCAFVIGPMCAINRISGEPPSHVGCAEFAAKACPFLTLPKSVRRKAGLPEEAFANDAMIPRNPGVSLVWITDGYSVWPQPESSPLFKVNDPSELRWFSQGRLATLKEVRESIDSGLPFLMDSAIADGAEAVSELSDAYNRAMRLVERSFATVSAKP